MKEGKKITGEKWKNTDLGSTQQIKRYIRGSFRYWGKSEVGTGHCDNPNIAK